jgi:transcriptional regulator with XRE-family HTH domain
MQNALRPRAAGERGRTLVLHQISPDVLRKAVASVEKHLAALFPNLPPPLRREYAWDGVMVAAMSQQENVPIDVTITGFLIVKGRTAARVLIKGDRRRWWRMRQAAKNPIFIKDPSLRALEEREEWQHLRVRLSPAAVYILEFRYLMGMSTEEIAKALGVGYDVIWHAICDVRQHISSSQGNLEDINFFIPNNKMCSGYGNKIRQARLNKGMTQEEVAAKSSVSQSPVFRLEKERQGRYSFNMLVRMSKLLEIPLSDLIPGIGGPAVPHEIHHVEQLLQSSVFRPRAAQESNRIFPFFYLLY